MHPQPRGDALRRFVRNVDDGDHARASEGLEHVAHRVRAGPRGGDAVAGGVVALAPSADNSGVVRSRTIAVDIGATHFRVADFADDGAILHRSRSSAARRRCRGDRERRRRDDPGHRSRRCGPPRDLHRRAGAGRYRGRLRRGSLQPAGARGISTGSAVPRAFRRTGRRRTMPRWRHSASTGAAGRGVQNMVYITISTGIGGGVIVGPGSCRAPVATMRERWASSSSQRLRRSDGAGQPRGSRLG